MPRLLGKRVADPSETIADNLGSVGEAMFRPVDPPHAREISEADRRRASRASAMDALRRGRIFVSANMFR